MNPKPAPRPCAWEHYYNAKNSKLQDLGKAVQVDPIKPTLKLPGTVRLKLKCG